MLKHILTGQPSSTAGSRLHHHNDFPGQREHFHHHHLHHHQLEAARSPRSQSSADVYDNVQQRAAPQFPANSSAVQLGRGHPLNHSQLSVNNLAHRLNASHHSHAALSASKHSVNSASPAARNNLAAPQQHADRGAKFNGGLDISRMRLPSQATPSPAQAASTGVAPLNVSWSSSSLTQRGLEPGLREMLTSLGLLCLVSLLLALLSLTFLIRMSSVTFMPNSLISPEEFAIVYDVTLVLCAVALSLNLCCLLVCAIQFLFAVKLAKTSFHGHRTNKYLQKSSISRVCAVGGFFISIPVFLTGMILYTFIQFQSTPAIVTSVFIGLGIVFCGCALVHTVFVWQKEKTNAMKALRREQYEAAAQLQRQQTLSSQQPQPQQSQQQHHHHHHQQQSQHQQLRSLPVSYSAASRLAASDQLGPISLGSHPRGLISGPGLGVSQQPHHHQLHGHRHVSMSPPLLISSGPHGPFNASQRSQHLGLASPPATPGDRSPTSPANKHNRSQQLMTSREAATGSVSPGLPAATLDLSSAGNANSPHELSTLV